MATVSITSNEGILESASAVLEVTSTNGRNADDTAFETLIVFQRRAAGGNVGIRTAS
jgi:hypothetical protein